MQQTQTVSMYYPAGLLYNTGQHRWHPIVFRASPRPSDHEDATFLRFRSVGHHTDGFVCWAHAKRAIQQQTQWRDTGLVWSWSGTGSPHRSTDFAVDALLATAPPLADGEINE